MRKLCSLSNLLAAISDEMLPPDLMDILHPILDNLIPGSNCASKMDDKGFTLESTWLPGRTWTIQEDRHTAWVPAMPEYKLMLKKFPKLDLSDNVTFCDAVHMDGRRFSPQAGATANGIIEFVDGTKVCVGEIRSLFVVYHWSNGTRTPWQVLAHVQEYISLSSKEAKKDIFRTYTDAGLYLVHDALSAGRLIEVGQICSHAAVYPLEFNLGRCAEKCLAVASLDRVRTSSSWRLRSLLSFAHLQY